MLGAASQACVARAGYAFSDSTCRRDASARGARNTLEPEATVLIVDHSEADRARFRSILSQGGYAAFEATRDDDVVSQARDIRPHLIILDLDAGLDGGAVCQAIRGDCAIAGTPVLILTASHDDPAVLAGLRAGADDYATKDSAPELILARVRRLVQYRKLADLAVLDRQLVQVGRLLAGIVHEIRGPLSVIRGSAELLRLAERGTVTVAGAVIDAVPTHAELASRISTHREAVSREMAWLEGKGIIAKKSRSLIIPDTRKLRSLLEESWED